MRYFPLFADLDAAGVLVAGGGEQAAQKVRLLRKTNARITVVAAAVTDELQGLAQQDAITIVPRAFVAGDLDGQRLVYAATGDRVLDAAVSRAAQARGIPVNVVDVPELSTFITPAIVDRAPVTVAIGTEGAAPVLARLCSSAHSFILSMRAEDTPIVRFSSPSRSSSHLSSHTSRCPGAGRNASLAITASSI